MSVEQVEEHLADKLRTGPDEFAHADPAAANLFARARAALRASLYRLDALPRSDAFWKGTNQRATILKLRDFLDAELSRDPKDGAALWGAIALDLFLFTGSFGAEWWRTLSSQPSHIDVRWIIDAALFACTQGGGNTAEELAHLLCELHLCEAARPILVNISTGDDQTARALERFTTPGVSRQWAERILAICSSAERNPG
jgi:hypothetical protein